MSSITLVILVTSPQRQPSEISNLQPIKNDLLKNCYWNRIKFHLVIGYMFVIKIHLSQIRNALFFCYVKLNVLLGKEQEVLLIKIWQYKFQSFFKVKLITTYTTGNLFFIIP